jgi:hypothetical protein
MVELVELLWPYLAAALAVGFVFGYLFCRA